MPLYPGQAYYNLLAKIGGEELARRIGTTFKEIEGEYDPKLQKQIDKWNKYLDEKFGKRGVNNENQE